MSITCEVTTTYEDEPDHANGKKIQYFDRDFMDDTTKLVNALRSDIARLTRERDEARAENARLETLLHDYRVAEVSAWRGREEAVMERNRLASARAASICGHVMLGCSKCKADLRAALGEEP